uniref:Uncharacterized protein n=1 Tax=Opuntia streptacantha TaxID=393608 RepID=A0A7C9DJ78_OPUST
MIYRFLSSHSLRPPLFLSETESDYGKRSHGRRRWQSWCFLAKLTSTHSPLHSSADTCPVSSLYSPMRSRSSRTPTARSPQRRTNLRAWWSIQLHTRRRCWQ